MIKSKKIGILIPLFSLPSEYGIGGLGKEALNFIELLYKKNITLWQILPLNYPDNLFSPYNPISSFSLNPFLICPYELFKQGLISRNQINNIPNFNPRKIDIKKISKYKIKIFDMAFRNLKNNKKLLNEFQGFIYENSELKEVALFIVLNKLLKRPFYKWEKEPKIYNKKRIKTYMNNLREQIEKECFLQFFALRTWKKIKKYANSKGIKIFGDLPFYVSLNSFEVWKYHEFFLLKKDLKPEFVGGVPPDMFSRNGQLWGNPCYNWEKLEKNDFHLLIKRIEFARNLYDYIRLDHFRGFEGVYMIKYGNKTARNGKWVKVPGTRFFNILKIKFKTLNFLIAEDLGFITEEVIKLRRGFKIPGMKVFQFEYKGIKNWEKNSVSYSSTHDTPTLKEWLTRLSKSEKKEIKKILGINKLKVLYVLKKYIQLSNSNWKIFQLQDLLELGKEGRINTPGTKKGNWIFRVKKEEIEKAKILLSEVISGL